MIWIQALLFSPVEGSSVPKHHEHFGLCMESDTVHKINEDIQHSSVKYSYGSEKYDNTKT